MGNPGHVSWADPNLGKLGHLGHFPISLNVIIVVSTMAVTAHMLPNYTAANTAYMINPGPILTTAGPPEGVAFQDQVAGLMQAVYSFGGAMLFVESMSEMRRPFDFCKGMIRAQTFSCLCYTLFGIHVYSY